MVEGRPQVLVHNGKIHQDVMAAAQLTQHELDAALRAAGCASVQEVHMAMLENNGAISILRRVER